MSLESWAEDHGADEIRALIEAVDAGDLSDDREDKLRELIEDEPITVRQDAVDEEPLIADLEAALGLRPTMPPEPTFDVDENIEIEEIDEDRDEAVSRINDLLEPTSGRDVRFYRNLAKALRTANADHTPMLTQERIDALTEDDRETLSDRAQDLANDRANSSSPVDSGSAGQPDFVDDREKDERSGSSGGGGGGGNGGGSQFQPGDPDLGDDSIVVDEDYMSGEDIVRDPAFEERFKELVRDLGRYRDFDFDKGTDDYFALGPENQRKFYDVTPEDFLERMVRAGEVTPNQLRKRGFDDDVIPEE